MTLRDNPHIHNAHLPGDPFTLQGSNGAAVLLMHGFTATCQEVEGLGHALHDLGYTTASFLIPGHGASPDDLNRTRWQEWVQAANAAYRSLVEGHQQVFVGGESTGGLLALYLAIQHPEIAGVLCYSPALNLSIRWYQRAFATLAAPFYSALPKNDLEGNTTWQGYRVNPLKALLELLRLQDQVRPHLGQIRQPVLIVQGRHDHTIDPHSSQVVYERVASPRKELHWLENSGHCVLLDPEQETAFRLTRDFLAKVLDQS